MYTVQPSVLLSVGGCAVQPSVLLSVGGCTVQPSVLLRGDCVDIPSVLCVGAHLSCLHLAGQMVGLYTHTALPTLSLVYVPLSVCMDMQCPS